MSKIAVTGGAGFIGSHIVDLLVSEGYEVCVIDDLSTGIKENVNPDVVFYEVNICDPYLREVLGKERPDAVVHLAAQVSVRGSIKNPRFDARTNIIGSIALLECCKDLCIEKVVYASSVGIYGEPQYLPVDERHPIEPISPYAASKHAVEDYLHCYKRNHKVDYVSLRYSNVYGPRQDPDGEAGVISIFIDRFLQNKKATINGDGEQTRDFVFVRDVAKATVQALEKDTETRIFNIGTGSKISIKKLYGKLKDTFNSNLSPVYGNPIEGEIRDMHVSPTLAEKELDWKAETTLDKGLKETAEWFKSTRI